MIVTNITKVLKTSKQKRKTKSIINKKYMLKTEMSKVFFIMGQIVNLAKIDGLRKGFHFKLDSDFSIFVPKM